MLRAPLSAMCVEEEEPSSLSPWTLRTPGAVVEDREVLSVAELVETEEQEAGLCLSRAEEEWHQGRTQSRGVSGRTFCERVMTEECSSMVEHGYHQGCGPG